MKYNDESKFAPIPRFVATGDSAWQNINYITRVYLKIMGAGEFHVCWKVVYDPIDYLVIFDDEDDALSFIEELKGTPNLSD